MTATHFAMVSEWMANGNIKDFAKAHPDEDRLGLVGFPLKSCCYRSIDYRANI